MAAKTSNTTKPTSSATKVSSSTLNTVLPNAQFNEATQNYLDANFGSEAAWYNDPEVGPILKAAMTAGKGGTALQGLAYADFIRTHAVKDGKIVTVKPEESWFGKNSSSLRLAQAQKINDPATYNQSVDNWFNSYVKPTATQMGAQLDDATLKKIAAQAYENNWFNTDQVRSAIQSQFKFDPNAKYTGEISKTLADYSKIANSYGIPLPKDKTQMQDFINGAIGVGGNEEAFTNYAKEQAKMMFPWMSSAIDAGVTPQGYLQPIATNIANTLEIPVSAIDWSAPKWAQLLTTPDAKNPSLNTPNNLGQIMNKIKTDPQYGYDYTSQARSAAADMASQLKQMFGY